MSTRRMYMKKEFFQPDLGVRLQNAKKTGVVALPECCEDESVQVEDFVPGIMNGNGVELVLLLGVLLNINGL